HVSTSQRPQHPQHLNISTSQRLNVCGLVDETGARRTLKYMINVTQNAARQLRSLLDAQSEKAPKGLRVQIAKGGCSGLHYEMTLGEKKEGDSVVERDGV